MIPACHFCEEPAQWQLRKITRFPLTDAERQKNLVPRGPQIEIGPAVCAKHKDENDTEFVPIFIGASISGAHHS